MPLPPPSQINSQPVKNTDHLYNTLEWAPSTIQIESES